MYGVQMSSDPQIQVDLNSSTPAYRQIVEQFRHHMVEGSIKPGDSLPGVRTLAMDLGIHFNTVAEAYRTLAQEGWLEVSQGKAVRVCDRRHTSVSTREADESLRQKLRMLIAEMRASGICSSSAQMAAMVFSAGERGAILAAAGWRLAKGSGSLLRSSLPLGRRGSSVKKTYSWGSM